MDGLGSSASLPLSLHLQIVPPLNSQPGAPLVGSVVKNLSANTGDTGLIPDLGRSHMPWSNKAQKASVPQLYSLCSRAWEEQLLKPVCPRTHALQHEKPT